MDFIKVKIHKIHETLSDNQELITADIIKSIYQSKGIKYKMLLEIFQNHNDKIKRLAGKEFAPSTIDRYKTAKKYAENYIANEALFTKWSFSRNEVKYAESVKT
ncbi:hypothetical protein [Aquimarina sp. MAR_2010_214]|uniref:hypothetical protein n=1 Tax=Aquimarina sp. MAR_2010_214 TaxID=1250026 RepID=UPI000C702AC5|nr:hypothetical protein [Aquimarina sp. MAR_2010_214]